MWTIAHRPYRLPFRVPVRTAHGAWTEREGVIVRVSRFEQGRERVGWGEAAPIPWFGTETPAEALASLVALEGRAQDLGDALARLGPGRPATTSALVAAWSDNEAGAATDLPGHLPVAALLPAGRAALAIIPERVELGFRVFKWKVGVYPAADERGLLDDLLAALPSGSRLRLDANGAWDRRTAETWLACAADRPIEYIEQPIAPDARGAEDLLLGLANDYPTPLALDEAINTSRDVERWLALGWPGIWVIKPALLEAPQPTLERLRRARADVVFGSALETRVGARSGLRLAFAWAATVSAERRRALGYGVWPLFADSAADGGIASPFVRRADLDPGGAQTLWERLA